MAVVFDSNDGDSYRIDYAFENRYVVLSPAEKQSGIYVRAQDHNRLYFAENLKRASLVLRILHESGREALVTETQKDPLLRAQWEDMSRTGFFQQGPGSVPLFVAELHLDAMVDSSCPSVSESYAHLLRISGRPVPISLRAPAGVDPAAAFEGVIQPIVDAVSRLEDDGVASVFAQQNNPIIQLVTPLTGEATQGPDERILELLDQNRIAIVFEHDLACESAERQDRFEALADYEAEGFLFPFRTVAPPALIQDAGARRTMATELGQIIAEVPNREVDLSLQRPARFRSPDEVAAYYDGLEAFLESLYAVDVDVSRFSCFRRYLLGILINRFAGNRVVFKPAGGRLEAWLPEGGAPLFTCGTSEEALEEAFQRLRTFFLQEIKEPACGDCVYYYFCPKLGTAPAAVNPGGPHPALRQAIFERESRIHQIYLAGFLREFFDLCEENMKYAEPLKLNITEDKQLSFEALYAGRDAGIGQNDFEEGM